MTNESDERIKEMSQRYADYWNNTARDSIDEIGAARRAKPNDPDAIHRSGV